jgi:hypothetical protein
MTGATCQRSNIKSLTPTNRINQILSQLPSDTPVFVISGFNSSVCCFVFDFAQPPPKPKKKTESLTDKTSKKPKSKAEKTVKPR